MLCKYTSDIQRILPYGWTEQMNNHPCHLVDAHAHLCDERFDKDRDAVLERALKAGVQAVVAVGENLADACRNLELAGKYPMIKAAAGLYPTHLDWVQAEEMAAWIQKNASRLAAIGEVGLDYWMVQEASHRDLQKEILKLFVRLANALDMPLNIHSRSAGRHAVALLLENNAARVQMHAFDGRAGAARAAVEAGYFFSIPPSVVRSRQKQKLVKSLPLSSLLAETDSPVLGPVPNERNEPANLSLVLEAIAQLKGIALEEVKEAVSENTLRLYGDRVLR